MESFEPNAEPGRSLVLERRRFLRMVAATSAAGMGSLVLGPSASGAKRTTSKRRTTTSVLPQRILQVGAPGFQTGGYASDPGSQVTLGGLVLEHLVGIGAVFEPVPQLAQTWRSNDTSTIWTFSLRTGVVFHDGTKLDAQSVVSSLRNSLETGRGGQLTGIVSPRGITASGPSTVRFSLDVAFGQFAYLVSSDNPASAIALLRPSPALVGTGPFRAVAGSGQPDNSAVFATNPRYWRIAPPFDEVQVRGYASAAELSGFIESDAVDIVTDAQPVAARLAETAYLVSTTSTTAHVQIHMRTDRGVFFDRRVRQALRLAVDGAQIASSLTDHRTTAGFNNPIASFLPSGMPEVAQKSDVIAAQKLLRSVNRRLSPVAKVACSDSSLSAAVVASLVEQAGKAGFSLQGEPSGSYRTDRWLNSEIGITEMPHRLAPAPLLGATLGSDGAWNAAHYASSTADSLVRTLTNSRDMSTLRHTGQALGGQLSIDVPILVPFFVSRVWASTRRSGDVGVSAHGQIRFQ